jgi:hypothetical protein
MIDAACFIITIINLNFWHQADALVSLLVAPCNSALVVCFAAEHDWLRVFRCAFMHYWQLNTTFEQMTVQAATCGAVFVCKAAKPGRAHVPVTIQMHGPDMTNAQ